MTTNHERKKITPVYIHLLGPKDIFVFGSNEAGIHGDGAAKQAMIWGAVKGQKFGLQGKTFAIPTKDKNFKTLPLINIEVYVEWFFLFAKDHSDLRFLVTPIGTGLAGLTAQQIAPMFSNCLSLDNVFLPDSFINVLNNK